MLKNKSGQRSHKRTKHSGMGGRGTQTSRDYISSCILLKKTKLRFKIFALQ